MELLLIMGIKKIIKKHLFGFYSIISDVLYRRPYFDPEYRLRLKSDNELLHLDLVITECCSLKCRDCSNLMQYYKHPENINSECVIADLKRLLDCFYVRELKVLGGEPFVNQKTLCEVLTFLHGEYGERVGTIHIFTNGTIIPNASCIEAMKCNSKVELTFSNYGDLSSRQNEFVDLCKENGIRHRVDYSEYWFDYGYPHKYVESEEFIKWQYDHCYNRKDCNTLYRGGFFLCPRQAHGIHLGIMPDTKDEYVDMNDPKYENDDCLRRAIISVVRRKETITACHYCIKEKHIHVPRGLQKE